MVIDSFCWIAMMHNGICIMIPWITLFSEPHAGLHMDVPLLRLCQNDHWFCLLQQETKWTVLYSYLTPEVLWTQEANATKTYCTLGVLRGFPLAPNRAVIFLLRYMYGFWVPAPRICDLLPPWNWRKSSNLAFPRACEIDEDPEMLHFHTRVELVNIQKCTIHIWLDKPGLQTSGTLH